MPLHCTVVHLHSQHPPDDELDDELLELDEEPPDDEELDELEEEDDDPPELDELLIHSSNVIMFPGPSVPM